MTHSHNEILFSTSSKHSVKRDHSLDSKTFFVVVALLLRRDAQGNWGKFFVPRADTLWARRGGRVIYWLEGLHCPRWCSMCCSSAGKWGSSKLPIGRNLQLIMRGWAAWILPKCVNVTSHRSAIVLVPLCDKKPANSCPLKPSKDHFFLERKANKLTLMHLK